MSILSLSLLSVLIISFLSLIGILLIFLKSKNSQKINLLLVSLAVGALLGDSFIHLLPESFEVLSSIEVSLLTILGILLFFIIEKILRWHHCHDIDCDHSDQSKHLIVLNLIGDSVHNFIDGMLIAASFMVSPSLGFLTSIAVLLHEIPQEIGDFSILIHAGLSTKKAILYNLLSSFSAFIGVILVFVIGSKISSLSSFLIPITAGSFIYLAATDLIPELHRHHQKFSNSLLQLLFVILGIVLMLSLTLIE